MRHIRDFRKRFLAKQKKENPVKPMLRLLVECHNKVTDTVQVDCHQQWKTFFKAERLGYIDKNAKITEKGQEYIRGKS